MAYDRMMAPAGVIIQAFAGGRRGDIGLVSFKPKRFFFLT